MKKALVATILGVAASVMTVASSYGQGAVFFDTYNAVGYFPVKWTSVAQNAPGGRADQAVLPGEGIFANITWQYGATTGNANLAIATSGPVGSYGPGFIQGPVITTAANYVGGPITFTIQAWAGGSSFGSGANTATGSLTWVESGIPFGGAPAGNFGSLPGPIIVSIVPEPSTFALAGLGSAALLIFRRRK